MSKAVVNTPAEKKKSMFSKSGNQKLIVGCNIFVYIFQHIQREL